MFFRDIELAVARVQDVDPLRDQLLKFIHNRGHGAKTHAISFGNRIRTVNAPPGTAAPGFKPGLSAIAKIAPVVHPRPAHRGKICGRSPGRRIAPPCSVLAPDQAGQVPMRLSIFQTRRQLRQNKLSFSPYPKIGIGQCKNLLRHDRKSNAAQHNRGIGIFANRLYQFDESRKEGLAAGKSAIVRIAQRHPDESKLGAFEEMIYGGMRILFPAEVKQLHGMPGRMQRLRNVIQSNRRNRRLHAVGVYQRYFHR